MVMAPRTSMSGEDTAWARTQRRLTLSRRRVAFLNFSISNGFHGEGLDDADARKGLLKDVVQLPHLILAAAAGSANVTSEFRRGENHQRNQDHGDERQPSNRNKRAPPTKTPG